MRRRRPPPPPPPAQASLTHACPAQRGPRRGSRSGRCHVADRLAEDGGQQEEADEQRARAGVLDDAHEPVCEMACRTVLGHRRPRPPDPWAGRRLRGARACTRVHAQGSLLDQSQPDEVAEVVSGGSVLVVRLHTQRVQTR